MFGRGLRLFNILISLYFQAAPEIGTPSVRCIQQHRHYPIHGQRCIGAHLCCVAIRIML